MVGEIYGKIALVMGQVGAVTKSKKNAAQGYQFRGIDDVMAHVQLVMADAGVICIPRVVEREREVMVTKSGGSMVSVRLLVAHDFMAADGSHVICTTLGEAMDSGDKASNKAMSAALKYALTEVFMIPTYEVSRDTEDDSPVIASPVAAVVAASRSAPPTTSARRMTMIDEPAPGDLSASIAAATTRQELEALVGSIKARPEAEKVALRSAYEARLKAVSK